MTRLTAKPFRKKRCFTSLRGRLARLAAGQRTVWTVTETLRKIYIA